MMEFLTVDGVMEAPEEWQFPYLSEDLAEFNKTRLLSLDALLLGKVTYEIFASSWPLRTKNEFGIADKFNRMPKFVISSALEKTEWNNSKLIKDNVVVELSKIKSQAGGDIGIVGSATLIQSLIPHGLIDEYQFLVHPIVLGKGKHIFEADNHINLMLTQTKQFSSGVVLLVYQPLPDK